MSMNRLDIIRFYKEQLKMFKKIGLGKKTEHGVIISDRLIYATSRRLFELQTNSKLKLDINSIYGSGTLNGSF